jgi:hypothetical protein
MHQPRLWIEPGCGVKDQPCARETGKSDKVDHQVIAGVMTSNVTGQHSGIGRDRPGVDDGQPGAGQGCHRPHSEDQGMGMTAADKDKIADEGQVGGGHAEPGWEDVLRRRP